MIAVATRVWYSPFPVTRSATEKELSVRSSCPTVGGA